MALNGLAESLHHQGKMDLAQQFASQCKAACQREGVKIDRSCYCRSERKAAEE